MAHTEEESAHGLNIRRMFERIGLPPGSYKFSSQYLLATGLIEPWRLAGTMAAADAGTQAAAAEGFGLPSAEELACGTPVVGTDHPVMRQVLGPGGWFADAEDLWATGHEAWWRMPQQASLLKHYETVYHALRPDAKLKSGCPDPKKAGRAYAVRKAAARQHVVDNFGLDVVRDRHWVPVLKQLGEHFGMD
jgi:glycosyltransferase involved in cell wall biosynthesis